MLALRSGQPSFPGARAGRTRPDYPSAGCRCRAWDSGSGSGAVAPTVIQHPSPGSQDFRSGHPSKEALPCGAPHLREHGKIVPRSPSTPESIGGEILWKWPSSTAFDGSWEPARACLPHPHPPPARGLLCWGREEAGGNRSFHLKPTPALKPVSVADCPRRVGRPTFSETALTVLCWDWKLDAPRG